MCLYIKHFEISDNFALYMRKQIRLRHVSSRIEDMFDINTLSIFLLLYTVLPTIEYNMLLFWILYVPYIHEYVINFLLLYKAFDT